jgi:hypothetical protein
MYLARVELRGENRTQSGDLYAQLHAAMEDEGFTRSFAAGDKRKVLPHATYDIETTALLKEVLAKAKRAALNVWETPAIVVVEYSKLTSSGLDDA